MTVDPEGIFLGFRILARLFPAPPLEEATDQSFEELLAAHQKGERLRIWGGFLGLLAFAGAVFWVLFQLSEWTTHDVQGPHYLGPNELVYFLAAILIGIHLIALAGFVLHRLVYGPETYRAMIAFHGELLRRGPVGVRLDY